MIFIICLDIIRYIIKTGGISRSRAYVSKSDKNHDWMYYSNVIRFQQCIAMRPTFNTNSYVVCLYSVNGVN